MARPKGQFDRHKEELYQLICQLSNIPKTGCFATTQFLAGQIGLSERQTKKYLRTLAVEGSVAISTTKPRINEFGEFYRKRTILPVRKDSKLPGDS